MPTVYRIEHPESGRGPWWHDTAIGEEVNTLTFADYSYSTHPIVREDIKGFQSAIHVVGVLDRQQLYHWFNEEAMEFLYMHDFVVRVYDVSEILTSYSDTQVAFDMLDATLIKELSLLTLLG